ncbi:peptide chain release factor N(5)-glutamine methyltransferase [Thermodesulfovibrio thiophilus]|uniref:peptide chain release factor N(5)-glutamine methyltransferase n=1 Tax=Thermodesulfovibrio thiophilus TaxID=340095 RepID=UPI000417CB74|nr:peptide chain release factor N(5)-glutamine methyltransferase [Thermodesulfovibrio thiophilus]
MKAFDQIKEIVRVLKEQNFDHPEKQAEDIVCHVLKIEKIKLYTQNPDLTSEQAETINFLVKRRLKKEPLQYILEECEFYNIRIKVGQGVLIPRPETEILVEEVIKRKDLIINRGKTILDLCTGSGCIALAIAKNIPQSKVYGIDLSKRAIFYANETKTLNNIKNASFIVGNLFEPLKKKLFTCITANPPYIKTEEIYTLQSEVKDYEPFEALNGGADGLQFYREILKRAKEYLINDGLIFLELGLGQTETVKDISKSNGFEIIKNVKDLAGIERVMILKNRVV